MRLPHTRRGKFDTWTRVPIPFPYHRFDYQLNTLLRDVAFARTARNSLIGNAIHQEFDSFRYLTESLQLHYLACNGRWVMFDLFLLAVERRKDLLLIRSVSSKESLHWKWNRTSIWFDSITKRTVSCMTNVQTCLKKFFTGIDEGLNTDRIPNIVQCRTNDK